MSLPHLKDVNVGYIHSATPVYESNFKYVEASAQFSEHRFQAGLRHANSVVPDVLAGAIHALALLA
ncbi:MAG TPA: BolA family transcriptional regulator, partial [Aeromonas salmonicida]|nr:BolA family transcriptional regulator [Aeromonas salmonicida]